MKALICPSLGPVENLVITDVAAPVAGDGEVLVEVAYAGLNFFDTLLSSTRCSSRASTR
jgi:NADPH:quinone reductase